MKRFTVDELFNSGALAPSAGHKGFTYVSCQLCLKGPIWCPFSELYFFFLAAPFSGGGHHAAAWSRNPPHPPNCKMKCHIDEIAQPFTTPRVKCSGKKSGGTGEINARKQQQQLQRELCFVKWKKMTTGERGKKKKAQKKAQPI